MIDNEIQVLVQKTLQSKDYKYFKIDIKFNNARDEHIYNSAKCLLKLWIEYQKNDVYQVDFECALRNYILLIKKSVVILGYNPSDRFDDFGLQIDQKTGKIWIRLNFPEFSNTELVKQLYMHDFENCKKDKIHNLNTNAYIRNLTGFKQFKSNEQKLSVMGALRVPCGYSCLISMTTGGGKSLITQTIAYQEKGLTIVIVPTVSLMLDQYNNAKNIIKSDVENEIFYYHSESSLLKFYECLEKKTAKILFISPESLIKNRELREKSKKQTMKNILKIL